jgi:hypothetical protein
MDFPILVCADGVEQAFGSGHFTGFKYSCEGSRLKFGGYQIYIGKSGEDLKPFEVDHMRLRAACAKWKQTRDVGKHRCELGNL